MFYRTEILRSHWAREGLGWPMACPRMTVHILQQCGPGCRLWTKRNIGISILSILDDHSPSNVAPGSKVGISSIWASWKREKNASTVSQKCILKSIKIYTLIWVRVWYKPLWRFRQQGHCYWLLQGRKPPGKASTLRGVRGVTLSTDMPNLLRMCGPARLCP